LFSFQYEYGLYSPYASNSPERKEKILPVWEQITLQDHRNRHVTYLLDDGLLNLRRRAPMLATWDDHETTNNAYGMGAEENVSRLNEWNRYYLESCNYFSNTHLLWISLYRLVQRITNLFAVPTLQAPTVRRLLPRVIVTKERPPIVSTQQLRLIWSTYLSVRLPGPWELSRLEPSLR
jgi:hypothetical protein